MTWCLFFFSSRRRHTRYIGDWSSDVCSSDLFGLIRRAIAGCVEVGILREILRSAGVFEIVEIDLHVPAGLHHVHHAEVIEGRSEERRVGKECRCGWAPYY